MSDKQLPGDFEVLLDICLEGNATESQLRQLEELIADKPEALAAYVEMMSMHAMLQWRFTPQAADSATRERRHDSNEAINTSAEDDAVCPSPASPSLLPSIVIEQGPSHRLTPSIFSPGGALFSYSVASLVMALGLIVGWCVTIARHADISSDQAQKTATLDSSPLPRTTAPALEEKPVGRITGMEDCRWADPSCSLTRGTRILTGQRLSLGAGLVEVTYDSGAKVLLQGPATYVIDTEVSGYLSVGRLTARVEKQPRIIARGNSEPAPSGSIETAPLFAVRTPMAVITDLGTEFAVEVSKGGACNAQVFQGKVEVRLKEGHDTRPTVLRERESVRVDVGRDGTAVMVREHSPAVPASRFVRRLPKQVPIKIFNTGYQLKEGDRDPNWQVVARSDDPNFKPQQAIVIGSDSRHKLVNTSARPSWQVSLSDRPLPNQVCYTFRSTFDLTGLDIASADIHGSILADDVVVAVRLNGRSITGDKVEQAKAEYLRFWASAPEWFVPGINVMEVDILNLGHPGDVSPNEGIMACGVLWEGSAKELWHQAQPQHTPQKEAAGKEVTPKQ